MEVSYVQQTEVCDTEDKFYANGLYLLSSKLLHYYRLENVNYRFAPDPYKLNGMFT